MKEIVKIGPGQSEGTSTFEVRYVLRFLLHYNAFYGAAFSGAVFPLFLLCPCGASVAVIKEKNELKSSSKEL